MIYTHVAKGPAPQCESPLDLLPVLSNAKNKIKAELTLIVPAPKEIATSLELVEPEDPASGVTTNSEVEAIRATPPTKAIIRYSYFTRLLELIIKKCLHF